MTMYILKSTNCHGNSYSVPFRGLKKLIEAYKSEVQFNDAQMFLLLNGELIQLTA